jgi:hypothetical protein
LPVLDVPDDPDEPESDEPDVAVVVVAEPLSLLLSSLLQAAAPPTMTARTISDPRTRRMGEAFRVLSGAAGRTGRCF